MATVYDLSPWLGTESCSYPGDPPFERQVVLDPEHGADYELSALSLSAHAGAHIDAPAHFLRGGKRIDDYPVDRFVLPVLVIDTGDADEVRVEHLAGAPPHDRGGLLFRTRNSREGIPRAGRAPKRHVALSKEAAERCVALGASLVGIDALNIDATGAPGFPAHHTLLGADVLVLEGIDLAGVAPGRYTLVALPLPVPGAEGAPVRAVLLAP